MTTGKIQIPVRRSYHSPAGEKLLTKFGVPSTNTTFEVVSLDGKRMVLHTEETTLYLRSF